MNIRLTILLVAILLLFGGTFLIVGFNRSPDQTPDQPWLYKIDDNSIVHIEVTYLGDTSVYDKKPGSTTWFIVEDGQQIPVFQGKWSGTPLLLSGPKVNRRLAEEMRNPSDFGLDPPESVVRVTERTGRTYEFPYGYSYSGRTKPVRPFGRLSRVIHRASNLGDGNQPLGLSAALRAFVQYG